MAYWDRSNAPPCLAVEYMPLDNGTCAALLRRGGLTHTVDDAASRQCIMARFGHVRDKGEARRVSRGAPELFR